MLAGVFVVLVLLVFTAWQAVQVRTALDDVAARMSRTVDQLAAGDVGRAERNVALAKDSAGKAHAYTRGPVWWTASKLPWIGDDVTAVRTVSEVVKDLTYDTIPDFVAAGARFGPGTLAPKNGRIDLDPIHAVAPVLSRGADEIKAGRARVAELEITGLLEELRGPVRDFQDKLDLASGAAASAALAAELMPDMLGADEPRTYLAIFQNNAEIRSQGGFVGAFAVLRADDGKVTMVKQGRPRDIGTFSPTFIDLSEEERNLFTPRLSIFPQTATTVPDFPRSAEILTQMWEARQPGQLDGVLSIDPVAMGYLMRGTGPIKTAGGQVINADNAAAALMRDAYLEIATDEAQNAFFDDVAQRLFKDVAEGPEDPRGLLTGLSQATGERRLMLWSNHPDEQDELAGTAISGDLNNETGARPEVGLFINDAAADKLSYYLDYEVDVRPRTCGSEGNQVIDVRVEMTSTVPEGAELPPSVIGPPDNGTAPGQMMNAFYVFSPIGGRIDEVAVDREPVEIERLPYAGREVGGTTLLLDPGETRLLEYVLVTARDQTGDPRLVSTPAALTTGRGFIGSSAC